MLSNRFGLVSFKIIDKLFILKHGYFLKLLVKIIKNYKYFIDYLANYRQNYRAACAVFIRGNHLTYGMDHGSYNLDWFIHSGCT